MRHDKPKNWYSEIKKLTGKSQEQLNFNINEPPKTTANDLNKFLASIVQSLPPLSYAFPDIPDPFSLPYISPLDVVKKIEKLKRSSICPLDIPVPLIKAFSDYLSNPYPPCLMKLPNLDSSLNIGNKALLPQSKRKMGSLALMAFVLLPSPRFFQNCMKVFSQTGLR